MTDKTPLAQEPELTAHYPSLAGRLVFITGGGSGIGASLTLNFLKQGAKVAFIDLDEEASQAFINNLAEDYKGNVWFRAVDVRDIEALQQSIVDAVKEMKLPLWGLVNNAARDDRHEFEDVSVEYWDNSFAINMRPHFFACQEASKHMTQGGSIINMGSVSWKRRRKGFVGYTTSKGAIHAMTRTVAQELGDKNIRVNSVVPGAILTERQAALWLDPELEQSFIDEQALKFRLLANDVTAMALFLLSDDARGCSGQDFHVDGGIV